MTISYTNGGAPESALQVIDGTHVSPDVYERVVLLQALAAVHGLAVHVIRLGGYATLPEQRARQTNNNHASTIPVAKVGSSTHGNWHAADAGAHGARDAHSGRDAGRVDLGNTLTTYTNPWLAQILPLAAMVGLVQEFGSADANHFAAIGAITWNPAHEEDDMPTMITRDLIRQAGTAPVYYSENRHTRIWIKDEAMLADYFSWMRDLASKGDAFLSGVGAINTTTAREVGRVESFGALLGEAPDGTAWAPSDADIARIAAAVAAKAPTTVDLTPILHAIDAGNADVLAAIKALPDAELAALGLKRA